MLRQKMFLLAAASLMTAFSALPAMAEQVAWQTDLEEAMTAARESNRPILMHFWTPDCVPCRRLEKSVLNQPRVVETLERQFIPVKVNAQDHPELARRYHVSSVPVDVIVTANNEELARMYTPQDADRYVAQLSAIAIADGSTEVAETATPPRRRSARPVPPDSPTESSEEPADEPSPQTVAESTDENSPSEEIRDESPAATVVASSKRSPREVPTADEPEPREVINRFARQNTSQSSEEPAESTAEKPNWKRWPRSEKPQAAEVASAEGESAASDEGNESMDASTETVIEKSPKVAAKSRRAANDSGSAPKSQAMGLDGYCPVTLVQKQAWKKGDARFGVVHRGRTYLFAGQEEKDTFFANPDDFSPALSGIDPVEFAETGEVQDGQRKHGVVYQNRVYLFSSERNLETFWQEPERYASRIQQAMETGDFNQLRR